MKVLLIHNFYRSSSPSGEDAVYLDEVALLRSRGVEVLQYKKHNDDIAKNPGVFSAAFDTIWSRDSYRELSGLIRLEKPDIAHFHNIWYLVSPSAYYACKDAGVPVVQTLHNFRMFCANGLLLRDGRVCEECIGHPPWHGVAHGCFRNSRLYSVPVVLSEMFHKIRKTWTEAVDAYISLTEFGRRKFIQCGLPDDRIFVKPNFLSDPPSPDYKKGSYALYLGRLSQEKGLDVLLDAAALYFARTSSPLKIKIAGDGPMRGDLEKKVKNRDLINIEFLGRKDFDQCIELLSDASFLIMPSVCYENFPMAIREAFACGKPVVTSRLGAMAEIVEDYKTGLLFNPGDSADLTKKIQWMMDNKEACIEMGQNARTEFESKYMSERNFASLMDIYQKTISARNTWDRTK